jgi:3-hydroxyacyl-CoA dehydrogenase
MLEDGALPEDIDSAMQAFGFEMGPFAFADLSGLDLTWKMRGEQPSIQRGITCCSLSATEIQRRSLLAIVNETALLMGEGVARQACDVDVVMVQGYGFPRWEGGPVHWARRQNRIALENDLKILARDAGHGFVTGDLTHLLTL